MILITIMGGAGIKYACTWAGLQITTFACREISTMARFLDILLVAAIELHVTTGLFNEGKTILDIVV